jgi:hypothetical protein
MADAGVLCMTFPDGDGDNSAYGWVKQTSGSYYAGIHYLRQGDDFDRDAWEKRRTERETRNREIERQRREKCLAPEQRHQEYQRLLTELALNNRDRQNLLQRGFTEAEITAGGYGSVQKFQRLRGKYHINLPGIGRYGNSLGNGQPGLIIPVKNALGQILAYQIRDAESHKWAKGAKLANGEQPMGVSFPLNPSGITNVIGTGEGFLKTQLASHRLGIPFLGAAGGHFTRQETEQALAQIQQVWAEKLSYPDKLTIVDYPDGGWKDNPSVARTTYRRIELMQSLGYAVLVGDWGQGHDKSVGDIDELTAEQIAAIRLVSPEEAFANVPGLKSTVTEFKDWVTKQAKRVKPQGFGAPVIAGELFTGNRVDALIKQLEKNRYVLDASWTGDGKSHAIVPLAKALLHRLETLHPEQEIKIYLTSHSYRQPTVEALTTIQAMPTRHGDRYFPHGELEEAANCIRSGQFNQVAEKGYNPHQGGKHNPICHSCPAFNYCGTDPGMFRQQRRLALQHQIIRCHPSQIPAKGENQLTVVIWDEPAEEQPTKTINTNIRELDQEIAYHRRHSQLSDDQKNILDEIASLLEKLMADAPKLGLDTADVLNKVNQGKDLNQDLLGELITLLEQRERDLFDIFQAPTLATFKDNQKAFAGLTAKETAKLKGQFRRSNQYAVGEAVKMTEEKLQELPSNGLIHLLRCFHGQASVQIQLFPQNLLLTIDRRQELAPIKEADYVIALDATNNGVDFACLLNIEKDKVKVIKRKTEKPFQNLKVVQIVLPGWGSSRPSDRAIEKAIAVRDALFQAYGPMPVLTYKAQLETLLAEGQWYRDSRGSNQFQGQPHMLTCGLPLPNLGAIKAQFLATGGQIEHFEEHYHRRSQKEVLQNFGRQRANRYLHEQFTHFIITGDPQQNAIHDLGWVKEFGADYVCVHGFEITPQAGDRSQVARWHIVEAIRSGFTTGSAIAEKLGCSRRNVTDVLTNAGATLTKITKALLHTTELGTPSYKSPIRLGSHLEGLPREILALLGINLPEAIAEVVEIIQAVGWQSFAEDYLPTLPQRLCSTVLATFWSFLDTGPPAPV